MRSSIFISILAVLTTTILASPAHQSATRYTKEASPTTKLAARHFHYDEVIPKSDLKRQFHNADYGSSPGTIPAAEETSTSTAVDVERTSTPGSVHGKSVADGKTTKMRADKREVAPATESAPTPAPALPELPKGPIGNNTLPPSLPRGGVQRIDFQ